MRTPHRRCARSTGSVTGRSSCLLAPILVATGIPGGGITVPKALIVEATDPLTPGEGLSIHNDIRIKEMANLCRVRALRDPLLYEPIGTGRTGIHPNVYLLAVPHAGHIGREAVLVGKQFAVRRAAIGSLIRPPLRPLSNVHDGRGT